MNEQTTDIMNLLKDMDINKIMSAYGSYGIDAGSTSKIVQQMMDDLQTYGSVDEVKRLTIANTDKLIGPLPGKWDDIQWSVTAVKEFADVYIIHIHADNHSAHWSFDLHRKPNAFHNYDLTHTDRILASFTYDEMKSPERLIIALCNILDFTTASKRLP